MWIGQGLARQPTNVCGEARPVTTQNGRSVIPSGAARRRWSSYRRWSSLSPVVGAGRWCGRGTSSGSNNRHHDRDDVPDQQPTEPGGHGSVRSSPPSGCVASGRTGGCWCGGTPDRHRSGRSKSHVTDQACLLRDHAVAAHRLSRGGRAVAVGERRSAEAHGPQQGAVTAVLSHHPVHEADQALARLRLPTSTTARRYSSARRPPSSPPCPCLAAATDSAGQSA